MNSLQKTLPASWYCSKPIYELERQSVFLQVYFPFDRSPGTPYGTYPF